MKKLWRGSGYDGLIILFLGWLYGSSILKFDWIAWTLVVVGALLLMISIGLNWQRAFESVKSRRAQLSANALIVSLLVLGIVGMMNFISVRHSWRVDTTSQQMYSLSSQTVNIIQNLEVDVKITALVDESQIRQMEDRLMEYSHYSGKLDFEIIDPIKEPDKVREIFSERKQFLDLPTLIIKSSIKDEEINSIEEEDISNALLKVTQNKKPKIYFTQGHGEKLIEVNQPGIDTYQFVIEGLKKQHFDVESVNLYEKNDVPLDCDVLVIAGPAVKMADNEVKAVGDYLKRGGSVLTLIDPESEVNLDNLYSEWNIKQNDDVVLETHSSFVLTEQGLNRQSNVSLAPTSAEYGEHPITKNFRYATSFMETRSLEPLDEESDSLKVTPLVYTSGSSWGETDLESLYKTKKVSKTEEDHSGPVIVGLAVEKTYGSQGRFVAMGDSDFAADAYVQQAPGNMDFFLNIVSWLAEEEELISVRPKDPENRTLQMSVGQQKMVLFFLIILLPILTLRWALYVYKNRS